MDDRPNLGTRTTSGHTSPAGTPRWAILLGIGIVVVLLLLMVVLHLTGVLGGRLQG